MTSVIALFLQPPDVVDVQSCHTMPESARLRGLPQWDDPAADLHEVVWADVGAGLVPALVGRHVRSHGVPRNDARTSKASESEGLKSFEPALAAVTRGWLYVHARMHALLDKTSEAPSG